MSDSAWEEYLAAARRLDALRRGAATAEDEPGRAATATLAELTRVRAQLAAQHAGLRALGVPEEDLLPSAAELAAARHDHDDPDGDGDGDGGGDDTVTPGADGLSAGGLGAVWTALRRSRTLAERADAVLAPPRGWAAVVRWSRKLLRNA